MQNLFKDFFYFTRGEKRGILILIAAICIVFLGEYLISARQRRNQMSPDDRSLQATSQQAYEEFITSLEEQEQSGKKQYTSYKQKNEESIPIILTSFNPNTADSITFRHLGLPAWMIKNVLHYRAKGGKFRKTEDLKKIYGMTEEQYSVLSPYIHIPPEDTARHTSQLYITQTVPVENIKYETGTVLDLNLADTTELKKIPGIGSGIARLIVGYRQRLGGFYQIKQLKDINLDIQQLQAWFNIDPANVHRINLNRTGVDRLRSHPYINFYQAKAIVEYRKKKGSLTSLKPFSLYEEFTKADLERISHYVCFE